MAELVLGPMLRYVGQTRATVWVETDSPCTVEVLDHRAETFRVADHHYAIVVIEGLEPHQRYPYGVSLDGRQVWSPEPGQWPASAIHTATEEGRVKLAFGSCRLAQEVDDPAGVDIHDVDALREYALALREQPEDSWPDLLAFLGDQIYAEKGAPRSREFIRSRRDTSVEPGEACADFEEFARVYQETWGDQAVAWLLSTVPSVMIFDDHEICDDWNVSLAWIEEMEQLGYWDELVTGGLMAYWLYQHLGNETPDELAADELLARLQTADDGYNTLHEFAARAGPGTTANEGIRWSFARDLGNVRLLVADSRNGRVLDEGQRQMLDDDEWAWLESQADGDYDHLLIASSIPMLLPKGMHYLDTFNEELYGGAWGQTAAKAGEKLRRGLDHERWPAFLSSLHRMLDLVASVGSGQHGTPPSSIVLLSGDVHYAYLAKASFPEHRGVQSPVWQAVCSPMHFEVQDVLRRGLLTLMSAGGRVAGKGLARLTGVQDVDADWDRVTNRTFRNQVATIAASGHSLQLRLDETDPSGGRPGTRLRPLFTRQLADSA
jgi:hypothetical protein